MATSIRKTKRRRGAAIVEFAVIAPVLVFLSLGMMEMGRGIMVKDNLTDAARVGCRTAIMPSATNTSVTSDINTSLTANNIAPSNVTVQILVDGVVKDVSAANTGSKISVMVSIPVSKLAWITPRFLPASAVESEVVVMRSLK